MGLRAGDGGALRDCSGITSLMVRNLETEEGVDGLERFRIGGGDLDFGTVGSIGVEIANLVAELGHHWRARWRSAVDEHGDVEIASGEALDDVGEMHANFVAGHGVFRIVGGDVDGAPGFVEAEMMRGCFVGEAHGVVATGCDCFVVGRVLCRCGRLLGGL